MAIAASLNLLLVFTRYMSLGEWERLGMFERETALYRRLSGRGARISFLTYGGPEDLAYSERLPGINLYINRWRLNPKRYERWAALLHARAFFEADIVKTNQASAVYAALRGSRFFRRPLVARMGFLPSDFARREHGTGSPDFAREDTLERQLCLPAQAIIVTTQAMARDVQERMPSTAGRIDVIPNYVDTDLFSPSRDVTEDVDIVFVGRLTAQKNIAVLLAALEESGASALLIGDGPLAGLVSQAVAKSQGRLRWLPGVANSQLPRLLSSGRLFVLPSLWEGHPKTLLEAMAAGRPVLGAASPGIAEEIVHGRTGWLCEPEPASLARTIRHLLDCPDLRQDLGRAARTYIVESCSLNRIVDKELAVYERLTRGGKR